MSTKDGGPAFPANHFDLADGEHGMSMRDYFAAKAMQGLIGRSWGDPRTGEMPPNVFAIWAAAAYATADAMLAAHAKEAGDD